MNITLNTDGPGGGVLAVVDSQVSQRSNDLNQSIPPTSYHQPAHRLKVNNRTEQNRTKPPLLISHLSSLHKHTKINQKKETKINQKQ